MAPEQTVRRIGRRFIQWWTPLRIAGVALLILAFLVGILGYFNERELLYLTGTAKQILKYLSANVSTELASLAITILFVDMLYQHREMEREKRRLILQMGSPDNAFAREAVRALTSRGWLRDGSLKGAHLSGANLQEADLKEAVLQEVNLGFANLQDAALDGADLWGSDLQFVDLQRASLINTNLQEVNLVEADLRWAIIGYSNLQGAKLRLALHLEDATIYGVRYSNTTTWPEGFTPPPDAVNVDAETDVED